MPRQPRVTSGTEIYHVMMRGINHQNIFEEPEDYYHSINILDRSVLSMMMRVTPVALTASITLTA